MVTVVVVETTLVIVTGPGVLPVLSENVGNKHWQTYIVLVVTDVTGSPVVIVNVVESIAALVNVDD